MRRTPLPPAHSRVVVGNASRSSRSRLGTWRAGNAAENQQGDDVRAMRGGGMRDLRQRHLGAERNAARAFQREQLLYHQQAHGVLLIRQAGGAGSARWSPPGTELIALRSTLSVSSVNRCSSNTCRRPCSQARLISSARGNHSVLDKLSQTLARQPLLDRLQIGVRLVAPDQVHQRTDLVAIDGQPGRVGRTHR